MVNAAKPILETRILLDINAWAGHYAALDNAARLLAVYGVLPLAAAAVYLAICSNQGWRRHGGLITLASLVPAVFVVSRLDQLICRPRPFLCHPVHLLICVPGGVSSPSVEMGIAGALAFGLFAYGGRLRWLPLFYLALLGLARVFCGVEYPLDQIWAGVVGCAIAFGAILLLWKCEAVASSRGEHDGVREAAVRVFTPGFLNPRHAMQRSEGWPVAAMGTCLVLVGLLMISDMPEVSLPPQQNTYRLAMAAPPLEEKSIVQDGSPNLTGRIARALVKLGLPGRIRRVRVGENERMSVAAIKFDVGPDKHTLSESIIQREVLAIVRTTLACSPEVSEVDVFGVTATKQGSRKVLTVEYSVAARREDAQFLFAKPPPDLTLAQAMSRFGLVYCRSHRGRSQRVP